MAQLVLNENGQWTRPSDEPIDKSILEVEGVQNPTVKWARARGVLAVKLQGAGNRSRPDFMFLIPGGKVVFMEFKRPGAKPEPLQTHTYKQFKNLGFIIEVHDSRHSAIASLTEHLK